MAHLNKKLAVALSLIVVFLLAGILLIAIGRVLPVKRKHVAVKVKHIAVRKRAATARTSVATNMPTALGTQPGNGPQDVPILAYHDIADSAPIPIGMQSKKDAKPDIWLYVKPSVFAKQLDWLKDNGYHTIGFEDLYDHWYGDKPLPSKPIILTFDDGYRGVYDAALPLLKARGMKGTFFVVPGFFNQPGFLTTSMVRELSDAGMEVESHTYDHVFLIGCSDEQLKHELKDSRDAIEAITHKTVEFFCYPNGYYNQKVLDEVKKYGYKAGASSIHGMASIYQNPLLWHRIPIDFRIKPEDLIWKIYGGPMLRHRSHPKRLIFTKTRVHSSSHL